MAKLRVWDDVNQVWVEIENPGFSTIKVGDVYLDADGPRDTLELQAGEHIELLPNETYDAVVINTTGIGDLSTLATSTKSTIVGAINEIKNKVDSHGHTHTQMTASASWSINHNLNRYPAATIVDSGGSVVVGDITYVDANNIVMTFTGEFAGKAYLN